MVTSKTRSSDTAPAAHLTTVEPVLADDDDTGGGGGVLVGHLKCDADPTFVPNMPGQRYCLAIDIAQAAVHHRCPDGQGDNDEPGGRVTP